MGSAQKHCVSSHHCQRTRDRNTQWLIPKNEDFDKRSQHKSAFVFVCFDSSAVVTGVQGEVETKFENWSGSTSATLNIQRAEHKLRCKKQIMKKN